METLANSDWMFWIKDHFHFLLLAGFMLIQWIALQYLLIHYMMNRKAYPTFTKEKNQIAMLEKLLGFQSNQIERLYAKMAELHREIQSVGTQTATAKDAGNQGTSMISIGELTLKKRLTELAQSGTPDDRSSKKVH